jgi:hypothetical protein
MTDAHPLVGFKVLTVKVSIPSVEVSSPYRGTPWPGPEISAPAPGGENEYGIHASHLPGYAEGYRKDAHVESETVGSELRVVKVVCSVLCIIVGSERSMVARDGWRSDDVRIVGIVASKSAESYSLRDAVKQSMVDLGEHAAEDFSNLDDFATPPIRRLAQAWNVPIFPEASIEAIAAEFGDRPNYTRDYLLPDLRESAPQSIAGDKELLKGIAMDITALATYDPDVARRYAWLAVNAGGWEIPNELAKNLAGLQAVDSDLAWEISRWLLDRKVFGNWGWPHGFALPFLIDHDIEGARMVAKDLTSPSFGILMYGMASAIPSLWRRDPEETERFGRILATSKDETVQRGLRSMLAELRTVAPGLAGELESKMPSKSQLSPPNPTTHTQAYDALERCLHRVLGVEFHRFSRSL